MSRALVSKSKVLLLKKVLSTKIVFQRKFQTAWVLTTVKSLNTALTFCPLWNEPFFTNVKIP